MSTTTEKPVTGFVMKSTIDTVDGDSWDAVVCQNGRRVFMARGLTSATHAEQIARDIMVRYGTVERPTI